MHEEGWENNYFTNGVDTHTRSDEPTRSDVVLPLEMSQWETWYSEGARRNVHTAFRVDQPKRNLNRSCPLSLDRNHCRRCELAYPVPLFPHS